MFRPFTVHTGWIETARDSRAAGVRGPAVAGPTTEVSVIVGGRALVLDLPGLATLAEGLVEAVRAQSQDTAATRHASGRVVPADHPDTVTTLSRLVEAAAG